MLIGNDKNSPVPSATVQTSVRLTPAISAAAYAAGQVVGGLMTFANAFRGGVGTGLLHRVTLHSKSAQTALFDLVIFNANPSASTFTNQAALAVNAADFDKVVAVVHISDWTSLGTPSLGQAQALAYAIRNAAGLADMYAVLVARGAATFASTSDLTITVGVIQD